MMKKTVGMKRELVGCMLMLAVMSGCGRSGESVAPAAEIGAETEVEAETEGSVFEESKDENQEETSVTAGEENLVVALAGKWRLAAEKTEKNFKEYDDLQSMWGTGIHYGNEMEIGQDESFRFYIAINYGGEGTVKEKNGHLLAVTEPYAPEGNGGSPARFEIVPVTEDGTQYLTMNCRGETLYWERLPE